MLICFQYYNITKLIMWTVSFNPPKVFDKLHVCKDLVKWPVKILNFSWFTDQQLHSTFIRALQRVFSLDNPGSYELQQLQMFRKNFRTGQIQLPRPVPGGPSRETSADGRVRERSAVWNCATVERKLWRSYWRFWWRTFI